MRTPIARAAVIAALLAAALLAAACGGDKDAVPAGTPDILRDAFQAGANSPYMAVVARVNGVDILGQEIAIALAIDSGSRAAMPGPYEDLAPPPTTGRSVLESLITEEVINQEAVKRGLVCTDQEVINLTQRQIGGVAEAAPEILEAWATHLGVAVDALTTDEQVLASYGRKCARGHLRNSIVPLTEVYTVQGSQQWEQFKDTLLANAEIEILDPGLQ